jgi:D-glycero-alpha-D-manno-heptose-7-phosphate kinase
MIISKAPFRISLFGGGTDLPSFYGRNGRGSVVSFSINKYMYIILHPYFHDKIRLKYSRTEDVNFAYELNHPLARECLKRFDLSAGLEIASIADVPSGTGLGSSSAFTVAMLAALSEYSGVQWDKADIAKVAADIEISSLEQPIGKQDQYGSAVGGLKQIEFFKNGDVKYKGVSKDTAIKITNNILLFYVGSPRSANSILEIQSKNMGSEKEYLAAKNILLLADKAMDLIEGGDLNQLGALLRESWEFKKKLAPDVSNSYIDEIYELGISNGAQGAKLLGAGGGGFMLFYCFPEDQNRLRLAMRGLRELKVELDYEGVSVIQVQ